MAGLARDTRVREFEHAGFMTAGMANQTIRAFVIVGPGFLEMLVVVSLRMNGRLPGFE